MSRSKLGWSLIAVLAALAVAANNGAFPAAARLRGIALQALTGTLYAARLPAQPPAILLASTPAQHSLATPAVRPGALAGQAQVVPGPSATAVPDGEPPFAQPANGPRPLAEPTHDEGNVGEPAVSGAGSGSSAASGPQAAPSLLQSGTDPQSQILEGIYRRINPSVVEVVDLEGAGSFGSSLDSVPQGEGSGFIWDRQGHIVTNDHVVSGADRLQVVLADGTEADARLVGTDPGGDVAVIQVDPALLGDLAPLQPGDLAQVRVGQMAIAIGNPFGYQNTMTRGLVSALGRTIPSQTQFDIPDAIQTDAPINPGNSGGPLLDESGQVIGINDQIQTESGSSAGVGFAIPIDIVQRIADALIQGGQYRHAYLGITGDTLAQPWLKALALPAGASGVYVMAATSGGPAAGAGLRGGAWDTDLVLSAGRRGTVYLQGGGEVITAIDGQRVATMNDLLRYLELRASPGSTVQLELLSHGQRQDGGYEQATVTVTLGARPGPGFYSRRGNVEPQA
jgi:2-alkenal reductase